MSIAQLPIAQRNGVQVALDSANMDMRAKLGKRAYKSQFVWFTNKALQSGINNFVTREDVRELETEIIKAVRPVLRGRSLLPVKNVGAGKTLYEYDLWGDDMSDAEIILPKGQFPRDLQSKTRPNVPIIKIGKGFEISREELLAHSALDTENAAECARKVIEAENEFIFNSVTQPPIDGLFAAAGNTNAGTALWSTAGGTRDPVGDVADCIKELKIDDFIGPYSLALNPENVAEIQNQSGALATPGRPYIVDILNLVSEIVEDATIPEGTGLVMEKGTLNSKLIVAEDLTVEILDMDENQVIKGNVFERISLAVHQPNSICELTAI